MPTTQAEFEAAVAKAEVNMDRLDQIVNGDAATLVAVDGGVLVPSFAKLQTAGAVAVAAAEEDANRSESAAAAAAASGFSAIPAAPIGLVVEEDSLGRVSRALLPDGGQYVGKLYRPGPSGMSDKRAVWAELDALNEATALPGKTEFQKAVLPAMAEGRLPRFSPTNLGTPSLTFIDNSTNTPSGYGPPIFWDNPALLREGGVWHNDDPNGWSTQSTFNPGAYVDSVMAKPNKITTAPRLEFDYDGDALALLLVGGGSAFKITVDGAEIEAHGGKDYDFVFYPPDGQYQKFVLALGSSQIHTIAIEGLSGQISLAGMWGKIGATFSRPDALPRPRVYIDGTSIAEGGGGWVRHARRLLNIDAWVCSVGGTGIQNPGPGGSGRANMRDRQNWRHAEFAYGIHQGIINDGTTFSGTDGSYNAFFRSYADQYRYILDSWGTVQNGRPWFALGFFPHASIPDEYHIMRDAMDQVCGEFNEFAHLIDPWPDAGVMPGTASNVLPNSYYFSPIDSTHPISVGGGLLGRRISRYVGDLIRGGRF